jgi:hypothetical protein
MRTDKPGCDGMHSDAPRYDGLRKICDVPLVCRHPNHKPPSMIVLSPGTYEHTCPGCGAVSTFAVRGTYL